MKKRWIPAAAALMLALAVFFSSCESIAEYLMSELENAMQVSESASSEFTVPEPAVTDPSASESTVPDGIPFSRMPEIGRYELPAENGRDPLEEEASGIIDASISRAIAFVLAMKDDRHSTVSYAFDEDANGFFSALSDAERSLFDRIARSGEALEDFRIEANDTSADLKKAWFTLYEPLDYGRPDLASYLHLDVDVRMKPDGESVYRAVFSRYFDPYTDANDSVRDGAASMKDVKHAAQLLDRVIRRIVRFMPSGLSTYDQYGYLAAVICEQNLYDDRPDNCYTPFGALIGRKSVCEGYSKAFYLLCREANLWCAYRYGADGTSAHIWNMVKLENGIYNVDVTWCDGDKAPGSRRWYDNFVKSDADFADNGHTITSGVAGTGIYEPCPYEN